MSLATGVSAQERRRHAAIPSLPGLPRQIVSPDGTPLHAWVAGPSDPSVALVLTHGYTMSSSFWFDQFADLARHALVVAFDHRGHGRSGPPGTAGVSLAALAADLDAVVDQAVPAHLPVVVAGHSMGGMAIMAYGAMGRRQTRDRLAGVVLCNTSAHAIREGVSEMAPPGSRGGAAAVVDTVMNLSVRIPRRLADVSARIAMGPGHDPVARRRTAAMLRDTSPAVRSRFGQFLLTVEARDHLASLDVPTTVIAGTHDRLTPLARSRTIADLLPDADLVVLDRAGHQAPMEFPAEVTGVLRVHLDRAVARRAEAA